jgi:glycosyltransferase involved in cell wall biosynthesis
VDHGAFHPRDREETREALRRELGLARPYVLFVSRIEHPGKNHVGLIRAFALLKSRHPDLPHELVLAGPDWTRAEEVHREATGSPASADIRFLGSLRADLLSRLYAGADAFAFPSLFEGFGLPVLEAMASGVPVACSNVSSIPEVAGDAAEMFDPSDPGAIADALGREARVAAGLARAATFSWQRTAEATREVLRRAAGQARRA